MSLSIGNLSGLFNGFEWIEGPLTLEIKGDKISGIELNSTQGGDIDGSGQFVSPGFNDGHTHLIFAGERSFELPLKVRGASYSEILEQGGGILNTIKPTREASDQELLDLVLGRLDIMLKNGTTEVEAKSGYGLEAEQELRQLRILNQADKLHQIKVHSTYCGAHALPPEKDRSDYVEEVISILPEIKNQHLATSTDVFCDRGAFSVDETREIFAESIKNGIAVRAHAEELEYTGIGKIAAEEYQALSVDHLLRSKIDDFNVYAENDTVAMFMPAATIGLFTTQKPSGWSKSEVEIGLGSDFNPNNWVVSMQTAIRLGVFLYRIDPIKSFRAATSGSFRGITGQKYPKLDEGSEANFLLINSKDINQFVTKFDQNLISKVFLKGKEVVAS